MNGTADRFTGRGAARAVLAVPGPEDGLAKIYIGGEGGLARYDLVRRRRRRRRFCLGSGGRRGDYGVEPLRLQPESRRTAAGEAALRRGDGPRFQRPARSTVAAGGRRIGGSWRGCRFTACTSGMRVRTAGERCRRTCRADAVGGPGRRSICARAVGCWPAASVCLESRDGGRTWRSTGVSVRSFAVRHDPLDAPPGVSWPRTRAFG